MSETDARLRMLEIENCRLRDEITALTESRDYWQAQALWWTREARGLIEEDGGGEREHKI